MQATLRNAGIPCDRILAAMLQVYHQGTSQFKGVSWAERSKKWRAQLWFGNKVLLPLPARMACSSQPCMLSSRRTRGNAPAANALLLFAASFSLLRLAIRSYCNHVLVLMSGVC